MPVDRSYVAENDAERARLRALVARCTDAMLAHPMPSGWTVASVLLHLAFWDQRVLMILRRWQTEGFDPSPIDPAAVNDSLRVICHALEPRKAIKLCLSSAEAADAELAKLTAEEVKRMEEHASATDTQFRMNRSLHRNGHLDDIEALLA